MNWLDYTTAAERRVLARIETEKAQGVALRRKIYDRCRKRMKREQENRGENSPANPHKS